MKVYKEGVGTMAEERRRVRTCPGCGCKDIARGREVRGAQVEILPKGAGTQAVMAPLYSDLCQRCGMVTLFARLRSQRDPG